MAAESLERSLQHRGEGGVNVPWVRREALIIASAGRADQFEVQTSCIGRHAAQRQCADQPLAVAGRDYGYIPAREGVDCGQVPGGLHERVGKCVAY